MAHRWMDGKLTDSVSVFHDNSSVFTLRSVVKAISHDLRRLRTNVYAVTHTIVVSEAELEYYTGSMDRVWLNYRAHEFQEEFDAFVANPFCLTTTEAQTTVTLEEGKECQTKIRAYLKKGENYS